MGCLKLTYRTELETPLKVVYSEPVAGEKSVQRFLSVDPLAQERSWVSPYNFVQNNPISRIDPDGRLDDDYTAKKDGTIEVKKTNDNFDRFYVENDKAIGGKAYVGMFEKNSSGLIQLPAEYNFAYAEADLTTIRTFGWQSHTSDSKRYMSGPAVAALFGALHETGIKDLSIGQFSKSDGSSPDPSKSHKLGVNGDLRPLRTDMSSGRVTVNDAGFDLSRNTTLTTALRKYGWSDILSERNSAGTMVPNTRHFSGYTDKKTGAWVPVRHDNHFHLQGFSPRLKTQ